MLPTFIWIFYDTYQEKVILQLSKEDCLEGATEFYKSLNGPMTLKYHSHLIEES